MYSEETRLSAWRLGCSFFSLSLSRVQDKQRQKVGKCPRKVSAEAGQTYLKWINSRQGVEPKF